MSLLIKCIRLRIVYLKSSLTFTESYLLPSAAQDSVWREFGDLVIL